jgi:hypothetical protein
LLRAIDTPLKLAIPGNHDFGLEPGYWRRTRAEADTDADADADAKASWELLRRPAQIDSIFLLPQGTHTFVLPGLGGGARLRLFASPLTPRGGNWGFQFDHSNPHKWAIPPNGDGAVDVVMTHGPPRGIRDGTGTGMTGAGCAGLLAAVERAAARALLWAHPWGVGALSWSPGSARWVLSLGRAPRPWATWLMRNAPGSWRVCCLSARLLVLERRSDIAPRQERRRAASPWTSPRRETTRWSGECRRSCRR